MFGTLRLNRLSRLLERAPRGLRRAIRAHLADLSSAIVELEHLFEQTRCGAASASAGRRFASRLEAFELQQILGPRRLAREAFGTRR